MFNLYKATTDVPCPRCSYPNSISMREVEFGLKIICRGCKATIALVKANGGIRKVKRTIASLENLFSK
jgi:ribosomal protein S27E